MIRWPARKTWFAAGNANLYSSGVFGVIAFARLEALAIPAAQDVHRHRELIAAHLRRAADLVGIDVDHFHDPVGVGAVVDAMMLAIGWPAMWTGSVSTAE